MSDATTKIQTARLDWDSGAAVRSTQFNDVYFSDLGGLEETRHVFLAGNNLEERFSAFNEGVFTIGELGFGTGLNILAAWHLWNIHQPNQNNQSHLHIVSTEAFPLSHDDFNAAQHHISKTWPELGPLCEKLTTAYPPLIHGFHRFALDKTVTLTLMLGDAQESLSKADINTDAWFLDGFSPSENPDMWSQDMMHLLARHSHKETSFATFTVAGHVRRALTAAGFSWEKTTGFGRKRDMLRGQMKYVPHPPILKKPWLPTRPSHLIKGRKVAIAGAGIAGASLAYSLTRAGYDVMVYDGNGTASGASGNPIGLIMPRLDLGNTPETSFYKSAYLHCLKLLSKTDGVFTPCGGINIATSENENIKNTKICAQLILPNEYIAGITDQEATELLGTAIKATPNWTHLYHPQAGYVIPQKYVAWLLQNISVTPHHVTSHHVTDEGVLLEVDGAKIETDYLIFANSSASQTLMAQTKFRMTLGQIDVFKDKTPLQKLTSFGNYAAPHNSKTFIGATYDLTPDWQKASHESQENSTKINKDATKTCLMDMPLENHLYGRAAIRCSTADHNPIAGPLPDWGFYTSEYEPLTNGVRQPYQNGLSQSGIFALTALGSRGLLTAPLLAEIITAQISHSPLPVSTDVMQILHPARFFIRHLIKGI